MTRGRAEYVSRASNRVEYALFGAVQGVRSIFSKYLAPVALDTQHPRQPGQSSHWSGPLRSTLARHWQAITLVVLALVVAGVWSVSSPPGSSPDEVWHLKNTWCADASGGENCVPGPEETFLVPAAIERFACHIHQPLSSAACLDALEPSQTTLLPFPAGEANSVSASAPNGYYRVVSLLVTSSPTASVILIRLLNAALFVALLATIAALVGPQIRRALIGAWIVGVVPLGLFIIPSVSNSSWTITGAGLAWAATLGSAESASRRTTLALAALAGLCVALAAVSRADGAVFVLLSVALGLCLSSRVRGLATRRARVFAIAAAAGVAVVVVLLLATTRAQVNFVIDPLRRVLGNFADRPDLAFSNALEIPQLWAGSFGSWGLSWGLGAGDVPLPAAVGVIMLLAVGFVIAIGLRMMWRAKAIVLALLFALLWLIPVVFLQDVGEQVGDWVQPRYLLPLILVFLGIALLSRDGREPLASRGQWIALAVAVSVAQALALHRILRRYVTGVDVPFWNLDSGVEWWWSSFLTPMSVWALGSAAFAALAVLGLRLALRSGPPAVTQRQSLAADVFRGHAR